MMTSKEKADLVMGIFSLVFIALMGWAAYTISTEKPVKCSEFYGPNDYYAKEWGGSNSNKFLCLYAEKIIVDGVTYSREMAAGLIVYESRSTCVDRNGLSFCAEGEKKWYSVD